MNKIEKIVILILIVYLQFYLNSCCKKSDNTKIQHDTFKYVRKYNYSVLKSVLNDLNKINPVYLSTLNCLVYVNKIDDYLFIKEFNKGYCYLILSNRVSVYEDNIFYSPIVNNSNLKELEPLINDIDDYYLKKEYYDKGLDTLFRMYFNTYLHTCTYNRIESIDEFQICEISYEKYFKLSYDYYKERHKEIFDKLNKFKYDSDYFVSIAKQSFYDNQFVYYNGDGKQFNIIIINTNGCGTLYDNHKYKPKKTTIEYLMF